MRLRTLVMVVAACALALALSLHVKAVVRENDEFAPFVLFLQSIGLLTLLGLVFVVWVAARVIRRDAAYAARLRHKFDDVTTPSVGTGGGPRYAD